MNEYEAALFGSIVALGKALIDTGNLSETALLSRLSVEKAALETLGSNSGAETIGILIKTLCEPPDFYVLGQSPTSN